MKKGIRCNDTHFTNGTDRIRIDFRFLSDDRNTPSSCSVRLGTIDPLTGDPISNVSFFSEYYKLVDHQVRKNLYTQRREYTPAEKIRRQKEKEAYIEEFTKRWGYPPSKDNVLYHLEQVEEETYHLPLSVFTNGETGFSTLDCKKDASFSYLAEMDEDVPLRLQALRDVAATLTGRQAEVYEAMIQRAAGGQERLRFSDIAKKWGVAPKQITMDQQRIMEKVRKRAEELSREE